MQTMYLMCLYVSRLVYLRLCGCPSVRVCGWVCVCQGLAAARPAHPQTGSGPNLAGVGAIWVDRALTSFSSSIYLFSSFPPPSPSSPPLTKSQLTCQAPPGASARLSSFGHLSLFVWLQGNIYTSIHSSFPFFQPLNAFSFHASYTQRRKKS